MYGDRRLTALFEDYIKEPDTLGRDYLDFARKVDNSEIDLFKTFSKAEQNALENAILFYVYNTGEGLNFMDETSSVKSMKKLFLTDPNFVVNTDFQPVSKESKSYNVRNNIMRLLKENGLLITFKCE